MVRFRLDQNNKISKVGMMIPLVGASWACLVGYAALGIGNAILQVSENPLIKNVVTDEQILTHRAFWYSCFVL